jgi:hypothetical protein
LDDILYDIDVTTYDEGDGYIESYIEADDIAKAKQQLKALFLETIADAIAESKLATSTPDYLKVLRKKVEDL